MAFKTGDIVQIKSLKELDKTFDGIDRDGDPFNRLEGGHNVYFTRDMRNYAGHVFKFTDICDDDSPGATLYCSYTWHPKWLKKAGKKKAAAYRKRKAEIQKALAALSPGDFVQVKSLNAIKKISVLDSDGDPSVDSSLLMEHEYEICGTVVEVVKTDISDNSVLVRYRGGDGQRADTWLHVTWLTKPTAAGLRKAEAEREAREAKLAALTDRQRAAIAIVKAGSWGCQTNAVRRLVSLLADLPEGAFDD